MSDESQTTQPQTSQPQTETAPVQEPTESQTTAAPVAAAPVVADSTVAAAPPPVPPQPPAPPVLQEASPKTEPDTKAEQQAIVVVHQAYRCTSASAAALVRTLDEEAVRLLAAMKGGGSYDQVKGIVNESERRRKEREQAAT